MTNFAATMAPRQFVSFRIDEFLMGIDILHVREINLVMAITPVQHAPVHVRGLINLRGQIVTILDLGVRLGRKERKITSETHNVILKSTDTGLLVDSIGEVITVENRAVERLPANLDPEVSRCSEGVVKLERELMVVIDPLVVSRGRDRLVEPALDAG